MASSPDMPLTCSSAGDLLLVGAGDLLAGLVDLALAVEELAVALLEHVGPLVELLVALEEPALEVGELGPLGPGLVLRLALEADLLVLGLEDEVLLLAPRLSTIRAAFSSASLIPRLAKMPARQESEYGSAGERPTGPPPLRRAVSIVSSSRPTVRSKVCSVTAGSGGAGTRCASRSGPASAWVERREGPRRCCDLRTAYGRPGRWVNRDPSGGSSALAERRRRGDAGDLRTEAVAGEQRIRAGPALPRVRDPRRGRAGGARAADEPRPRRDRRPPRRPAPVRARLGVPCRVGVAGAPLLERAVDHGRVHAPQPELPPQGGLAARAGPVARLDPGPGERRVVEQPERRAAASIAPSTSSGR